VPDDDVVEPETWPSLPASLWLEPEEDAPLLLLEPSESGDV
jgi:hypothetical protein